MSLEHIEYMSQALRLAERGRLSVSPNPMVGCVFVKNGAIIGQGYHQQAGKHHAEIHALQTASEEAHGATAYVTLEPCCHYGKTPPCTQALITAGIKKVYVAVLDPNPLVAGNGIKALKEAGIEVEIGLLQEKATQLNAVFFHYITHHRPFVIAKWAMSLDGKTTTHPDDTRHISSQESQQAAHQIRQAVDAILIGRKTALHDNPLLTARPHSHDDDRDIKQPTRIILSTHGSLPIDLNVFDPASPEKTLIATTQAADDRWIKLMAEKKVEILVLPKDQYGQVDLHQLLAALGKRQITSLLVEGGMTLHESFFRENLVNRIHVYLAPVIIASLDKKKRFGPINVSNIAHDLFLTTDNEGDSHV